MNNQYISKVVDLTNPAKNTIYNMTHEEAVEAVGRETWKQSGR